MQQTSTPSRNTQTNVNKRMPLPIAVELYNVFPLEFLPSSPKKWFRPAYSVDLLYRIRLDVSVKIETSSSDYTTSYSSINETGSVCPKWQFLNEKIMNLTVERYDTMRFQFYVVTDIDDETSNACFLDMFAHPSKLTLIGQIPPSLPVNAPVIYFSDDSIRIPSLLYQRLLESQQAEFMKQRRPVASFTDDFSRFGDDAFSVLDQVTPTRVRYDGEGEFLIETNNDCEMTGDSGLMADIEADVGQEHQLHERTILLNEISREAAALEMLLSLRSSIKTDLENRVECIETTKKQLAEVEACTSVEQAFCAKVEFALEAQRIKIVRDLWTIYPIIVTANHRYKIRNLEIPGDLYGGSLSEDDVSAALGLACHTLSQLSKYLAINLPYRLHCHGSRSSISDDRGVVFALFQARAVEREKLEYAVHLLDLDVECICKNRAVAFENGSHLLLKIRQLYDSLR